MTQWIFIPFGLWQPDGSAFGDGLVRADNSLVIHQGHRPVQKALPIASVTDGPPTGAYVHIFQQVRNEQIGRAASATFPSSGYYSTSVPEEDAVNEATPDDADYIFGRQVAAAVFLDYDGLVSPGSTSGHLYRFRYEVIGTQGSAWQFEFDLYEGVSTAIKTHSVSGTGDTAEVTEVEVTLSAAEAGAIGAYADLGQRFTVTTLTSNKQYGRPVADALEAGWRKVVSGTPSTTNLWQAIDETVADDADYIESPTLVPGGASATYRTLLTDLVKPEFIDSPILRPYRVRYRYKARDNGLTLVARLLNGLTVVASETILDAATTETTDSFDVDATTIGTLDFDLPFYLEFMWSYPTVTAPGVLQTILPDSDIVGPGAWSPSSGSTLWEMIDADDSNVVSISGFGSGHFEVGLANPVDPEVDTDFVLKIKGRKLTSPATQLDIEIRESGLAKYSTSIALTSTSVLEYAVPIPASAMATIVNLDNVSVRINYSGAGGAELWFVRMTLPEARRGQISWTEFEVPSFAKVKITWCEFRCPAAAASYVGDKSTFYAGTKTKLYGVETSGFTDLSKGGGYGGGSDVPASWSFTSWGEDVLATNYVDPVQVRAASSGPFADAISTPSPAPKARFIATVRERVLLGGINLSGHAADEIWWSAANDRTDFTPSLVTGADYQKVVSRPGEVMGLIGGENGIIFKRNSIHLLSYVGEALVFRLDDISAHTGTTSPLSVVGQEDEFFFWGGGGFYRGGLGGVQRIGDDAVTRYLTDVQFSPDAIARTQPEDAATEDQIVVGARDPFTRRILWSYQAIGDAAFRHSRAVAYDPETEAWSPIVGAVDVSLLATIPNIITSDQHLLAGIWGLLWDGSDMTWFKFSDARTYAMTFETKVRELGQEGVATIRGVKPIFSWAGSSTPRVTITVTGGRDQSFIGETVEEVVSPETANSRGVYPFRVPGLFFKFKVEVAEMTGAVQGSTSRTVDRTINKLDGLYVEIDFVEGKR